MRAFAAVVAIAAAGFVATGEAKAVPGKYWGVVPQGHVSLERFQRLKRGGVDSVRVPIFWGNVKPAPGAAFDWSSVDATFAAAAGAGLEVLPFLYGAPSWAVPPDRALSSSPPRYLPVRTATQRDGWTEFLREVALRYGPAGGFWAAHPNVPVRPIRTWQIWNEQNFKYFVSRPNPAEYGKLVKLSYAALRSADGGAKLVLGGMFAHPIEALIQRGPPQAYFAEDFLEQMYRRTPGIKGKFHGVALHPYTGTYKRLTPYVEAIRQVLLEQRDGGKGLWLTELGWSSQRPRAGNSFAKGRRGQVTQLKGAFRLLSANQRRWRVQRLYWFSVEDLRGSCNFCDGSGLFTEALAPKPAWRAYVGFAGGRP